MAKSSGQDKRVTSETAPDIETSRGVPPVDRPPLVTDPPRRKTELEEAQEALWRLQLHADAMRADIDLVLRGPLAGKFRKAADGTKCPVGGDARHFPPLALVQMILDKLGAFKSPVLPDPTGPQGSDGSDPKSPAS